MQLGNPDIAINFYRFVCKVRTRIVLADFDDVTADINVAIRALNEKFHSGLNSVGDIAAASNRVHRETDQYLGQLFDGDRFVRRNRAPDPRRRQMLDEFRPRVAQDPNICTAQNLYDRLVRRSAGDAPTVLKNEK